MFCALSIFIRILDQSKPLSLTCTYKQQTMGKSAKKENKPLPPCQPHKVAYFVYRDEVYPQMRAKYKSVNKGDMAQLISNQWDSLDKPAKQQYQKRLDKIKIDYQLQKSQYEAKYGKIDPQQQKKRQLIESRRREAIQKAEEPKSKKKKANKKKDRKESSSQQIEVQESQSQSRQQLKSKSKKANKSKSTSKSKANPKSSHSKNKKNSASKTKTKNKQQDQNYRMMWVVDKTNHQQPSQDE